MYAINFASIVPVRAEHTDESEIMTQLLFGDTFEILETYKQWKFIRSFYDNYEGWIDEKVVYELTKEEFEKINNQQKYYTVDIVSEIVFPNSGRFLLPMGSVLPNYDSSKNESKIGNETGKFSGKVFTGKLSKDKILELALSYTNTPYLWGGKTHFGLDCSGLTQMVYKIGGYFLLRNAKDQEKQGTNITLDQAEPGDLAFFSNEKGKVIHVGILLGNGEIFHSHGNAHIDPIDKKGIWSNKFKRYSHRLTSVKKII